MRPSLLREVMPGADRFDPAEGSPPIRRAYRGDQLLGYVFLTADLPPEERGYSGPVRAVVGMTPDGTLTGVRVTEYRESYMSTKGDFLRRRGFQEQYAGKYIGDGFRVYEDIDGISKVSITVRALSRGVRDAARRIAAAYPPAVPAPTEPAGDVLTMSWFQIQQGRVATRMDVTGEGEGALGISLIHLESEELARYLVGGLYQYIVNAVDSRGGADELVLYAVDGPGSRLAIQQGWSIEQNGVRTPVPLENVVMLGSPWEGLLAGETSAVLALAHLGALPEREDAGIEAAHHLAAHVERDARMLEREALVVVGAGVVPDAEERVGEARPEDLTAHAPSIPRRVEIGAEENGELFPLGVDGEQSVRARARAGRRAVRVEDAEAAAESRLGLVEREREREDLVARNRVGGRDGLAGERDARRRLRAAARRGRDGVRRRGSRV